MAGIDEYTVMLIQSEAENESTSFADTGGGAGCPHAITNSSVIHSTAQACFGASSAKFNGSSSRLQMPSHDDWKFGAGDFTLDARCRWSTVPGSNGISMLLSTYEGATYGFAWQLRNNGGTMQLWFGWGNSSINVNWLPDVNTWYHVLTSRSGTDLRTFVDGVQIGAPQTCAWNMTGGTRFLTVGCYYYTSYAGFLSGYMEEVRISKGVARETADFTPPVGPYALAGATVEIESLPLYLSSIGTDFEALRMLLATISAAQIEQLRMFLTAVGQDREHLPLYLSTAKDLRQYFRLFLSATDGVVTEALKLLLSATDGVVMEALRLHLSCRRQPPSFRSVVAQRLFSVLGEA